jgi:hypothetical protein
MSPSSGARSSVGRRRSHLLILIAITSFAGARPDPAAWDLTVSRRVL